MKKIMITGGNGFIGRNIAEQLSNSYEIYAPKREELDLLNTKRVEEYINSNKFDVIIHSAVQDTLGDAKVFEGKALDRNLRMFFNLERCSENYGKMLYFGSGADYDKDAYIPNMSENYFDNSIPKDVYGFSKYIMSKFIDSKDNIYNLRLFGVFGKYENWEHRFISNAICKVLKGMNITIRQNVYFDYLYIDDLCKIVSWFIENNPKYNNYNVCVGSKIDLITIAQIILKLSKNKVDIIVDKDGLNKEYTGDNTRLIGEMGDIKFIPINKSVEELYNYYLRINKDIDCEKLTK